MASFIEDSDLLHIEEAFWLLEKKTNNPAYDFDIARNFACRRPWQRPVSLGVIARVGAIQDYNELYNELAEQQLHLVNSPQQHLNGSELPYWYHSLEDLTPRSRWYETVPLIQEIEKDFSWPVFVKGARQTSQHDPRKSIAHNPMEFRELVASYQQDPILRWQQFVVREFVPLRPVPCESTVKISPSFEFRSFWWKKQCVGFGRYWSAFAEYNATAQEQLEALQLSQNVAQRIDCPLLVVDVAQTAIGRWIVIECNDGQESGYAGVSPFSIWQKITEIERLPK